MQKKKIEPGASYDARNIQSIQKFPQQPSLNIPSPKPQKKYEPGVNFDSRNIKELPQFTQQQPLTNRPPIRPQKQYETGIAFDARSVGNRPFRPQYNKRPSVQPKERIKNDSKTNTSTYAEVIAKNIKERESIGKVAILGDFNNLNIDDNIKVDIVSYDDVDLLPAKLTVGAMIIQGMVNLGFGLDEKLI